MKPSSDSPKKVRAASVDQRWCPLFVTLYFALCFALAAATIVRTWPGGLWITQEVRRRAIQQVTADSRTRVTEALHALKRLPNYSDDFIFNQADERVLRTQLAFALSLCVAE